MAPSLVSKEPSPEDVSSLSRSSKTPYSNSYSSLDGCELVLEEQWKNIEAATARLDVGYSTMLKAAWVIALQCFQPSDVTYFSYRVDSLESSCSRDKELVYAFRVDLEENLQDFLERIDRSKPSLTGIAPEPREIQGSKNAASGVVCYSSIRFIEQRVQRIGSQKPRRRDAMVGKYHFFFKKKPPLGLGG